MCLQSKQLQGRGGGEHEYVQQSEYMFLLRYISMDVYLFKICQNVYQFCDFCLVYRVFLQTYNIIIQWQNVLNAVKNRNGMKLHRLIF